MLPTVLAAALAMAGAAQSQDASFERIAACFQSLQAAAPASMPPTDQEIRRLLLATTTCGWIMVTEKLTPAEAAAVSDLKLELVDGDGPTARVNGKTVYVSVDGIAQAGQVGQVVGHDIFVNDGNAFPVPSTVAYGPLARQPINGLTDRLSGWIDGASSATACQDPDCKVVQGLAIFLGIDGFLLAHEAAHVLASDDGADDLERELAADRWAYALLRRYDKDFEQTDTLRLARTAARLAPILYFDYLRSRLITSEGIASTSPLVIVLTRRRDQLAQLADDDDKLTLRTLRPLVDVGVGRLTISVEGSAGQPVSVWIDGVPLRGEDVVGHERVVIAGLRRIAVRSGERFGYVSELIDPGERTSVSVTLSPRLPPLPAADLEALAKRRDGPRQEKWAEIFLHTAGDSWLPRSPDVAPLHYRALDEMGLGSLIPPNAPGLTDRADVRRVDRWRARARPLSGWY
jgi:hypothetical protein